LTVKEGLQAAGHDAAYDFRGPVTAQEALIRSRNIPALYLNAKLNKPSLYDFLQQAGISGLKAESHYGLSLALGAGEVTMAEIVRLYAMLANQGILKELRYRLDDPEPTAKKALLNPAAAYIALDMLSHNPRPDSKRPALPKVAWKTGTSWGFKDAWSVGILPNEDCPKQVKTWFIPGVSPIKTSSLHKAVYYGDGNAIVCKGQPYRRKEIFEFWPDDMALLFREAGMPRRQPPALPTCYDSSLQDEAALDILSPSATGIYTLQAGKPSAIGLKAKSRLNGDIFWFANKSYIGKVKAGETLFWTPANPGAYLLRAADSHGHVASRPLRIAFLPSTKEGY
jgi:membrane carboxypeptidase/penicillin-binding protein PbpC